MDKDIIIRKGIEITRDDERAVITHGRVEIRREGRTIGNRLKNNGVVYILLDCSTSMEGDYIGQAKEAALDYAKGAILKGYSVGLITFASSASHLCEPQSQLSALKRHLEGITAEGSTNMTEAIYLATMKLLDEKGPRWIFVATDGMPDNKNTALLAAKQAKGKGIVIDARGTDDADEKFLKKLASKVELGVKVPREQFAKSIASAAKSLPLLEAGRTQTGQKGRQ